jgi:hypothetical protein
VDLVSFLHAARIATWMLLRGFRLADPSSYCSLDWRGITKGLQSTRTAARRGFIHVVVVDKGQQKNSNDKSLFGRTFCIRPSQKDDGSTLPQVCTFCSAPKASEQALSDPFESLMLY